MRNEYLSERIKVVAKRLEARCDRSGKAKPGFTENVAALKAEMGQLQDELGNI